MKILIPVLLALCCPLLSFCQDITGLWKGTMYNDSTKQSLDYEIIISKTKGKLTGLSHTSYLVNDKKYYAVKRISVRVARDGKIVLQDARMLENNYDDKQPRNIIQLDVLDLANSGEESYLDGIFVTNRSKEYQAFSGRMSIKKVNPLLVKTELAAYLRQNNTEEEFTVIK